VRDPAKFSVIACVANDRGRRNGGFYRRYDEVLHRDIALKVVKKGARLDPFSSQRLLHEARASFLSLHPNNLQHP